MGRIRRSLFVVAAAVLAVVIPSGVAVAAPTWLSPTLVSAAGQDTTALYTSGVAMDTAGDVTVLWGQPTSPTKLVSAEHLPGGGWSAPADVSPTAVGNRLPDDGIGGVAVDGAGTAYAFWIQQTEASSFVPEVASRPRGGGWSAPQPLDVAAAGAGGQIVGAVNAAGDAVAIWVQSGGTGASAHVATKPAGGAWSAATALENVVAPLPEPSAAVDAAGDAVVVWTSGGTSVRSAVHPAGGAWSAVKPVATGTAPKVGIDDAGDATAVFQSTAATSLVEASTLAAGAASWSSPQQVSDNSLSSQSPEIAVAGSGDAVVGWVQGDFTTFTTPISVHAATRAGGSGTFTSTPTLATGALGPAVAIDAAGTAIVTWQTNANGLAAAVRPPGGAFGAAQPVGSSLGRPVLAIDEAGDAVVAAREFAGVNGVRAAAYDAAGPTVSGVTFPATAAPGAPFSYAVGTVLDVWDPAPSAAWAFGDGQAGPPSGTHAYLAAGSFTATLTATDASGNTTVVHRSITVGTPSGHGSGGGPGGTGSKPVLGGLKLSPSAFRAARSGASVAARGAPVGTTVRYTLSTDATVRFTVLVSQRGIRSGRRCVRAPRHPPKGAKRCALTKRVGAFSKASKAGGVRVRFTGRVGGKALKRGSYVLSAVARNAAGASRTLKVAFRILAH